ncbi:hypothetical protein ANN_26508 [Periplaneta americana]|uniref:Glucose-methanol-choline oxidoreductase N-terminal domain-containing protein n=1 Tax=Periplaneta americana TaxID=6978 RepID=A0ABQ8RYK2_PERAM|nr:hypothetical protein ANN_26508 [Periplaneta americana]
MLVLIHILYMQVLGGCSVLNGMMYLRGHPRDYDDWARAGNTGWSYQDVLPYFIKSEDNQQVNEMERGFHGVGGLLTVTQFPYRPPLADAILQAGQELGYPADVDLNGKSYTGFIVAQTTSRNGSRLSSARAFLRPARDRPNLTVILNATATKVLIDPATKTANGVQFVKNGEKMTAWARKEVVLSAGAINSPQLLLLSGVGPKEELAKVGVPLVHDLKGVGRNLHNHVAVFINFITNQNSTYDLDWATATEYMLKRRGPLSSTGMSQVTAKLNSKYADASGDHPDVQLFFGGYLANCAKSGTVAEFDDSDADKKRRISVSPVVLHPKSRGYLTLKSSNPMDPPRMYANYLSDPADMATLLDAINITLRLGQTKVLRERFGFRLDMTPLPSCAQRYSFGTDGYWECFARTATGPENHQAGSCKMGPSNDPMAVVDPELKVYGIKNLRVMDAAIMPAVISGNTNAPAMMIGEKGADMIKKRWLSEDVNNRFGGGSSSGGTVTAPAQSGGGYGGNQGHSGYGGYQGHGGYGAGHGQGGYNSVHDTGRGNTYPSYNPASHPNHNQGYVGSQSTHGNNGYYADAVPEGSDGRYQNTGPYNNGGYNTRTGYSNNDQYPDRCTYNADGSYSGSGCNGNTYNSNTRNPFDYKQSNTQTPSPVVHSGSSWSGYMNQNGHQNYWVASPQTRNKL